MTAALLAVAAADAHARKGHRLKAIASDTARRAGPIGFWGEIDCVSPLRHQWIRKGGDPHRTGTGARQRNRSFRRLTLLDGDDFQGNRCELGEDSQRGPVAFYREGQRRITQLSLRLPRQGISLGLYAWQVVMQMKQAGPAANSGGTPVLELDAYGGRWRLRQSDSLLAASDSHELWSAPARPGVWTRFSFDVRYSQDPSLGSIKVSLDLNGDRDFRDRGERGRPIRTYTLKIETPGGSADGVDPGQSIPSHLRVGLYHSDLYACPLPLGCFVDVDNVQILRR